MHVIDKNQAPSQWEIEAGICKPCGDKNIMMWFMEGLSMQRDLIKAVRQGLPTLFVLASHRQLRPEILGEASAACLEPDDPDRRLTFMATQIKRYGIQCIHVGRNGKWYEQHRADIESMRITLITGATTVAAFEIANDKTIFTDAMTTAGLPVVPSVRIDTVEELANYLDHPPFEGTLCVKPVCGIYGEGFWRLDPTVSAAHCLHYPDTRRIRPDVYLNIMRSNQCIQPLMLMPYLPGPEHSVDLVVEKGKTIVALSRKKSGMTQLIQRESVAIELAKQCAAVLSADGLVNVQTRDDAQGNTYLLEINLRPSGGVGYTLTTGTNLPALMVQRRLNWPVTAHWFIDHQRFREKTVRPITTALPLPDISVGQQYNH